MLRKTESLSRLLLTALVASVIGCQADSPNKTSDQIVGPVTPTTVGVTLTSSKKSLVATTDTSAVLTVTVTRDGAPAPNLTEVTISTTLGALDSPTGGPAVTVPTSGGKVTVNFFPGAVDGTARLTATALGGAAITTITILPASGIVEPPTASTLEISTTTTSVSAADTSTEIDVTAIVLGSNTKPFKNAPVQFSATKGLFDSSGTTIGAVLKTNSAGQATDTLVVLGADLAGVSSITITVTLFVDGGGTITKSLTIPVGAAPSASKVTLSSNNLFINDDTTDQNLDLSALVQDAGGNPFEGGSVTFSSSFASASFSPPNPVVSDSSGIAATTATMTAANVAAFPGSSFTITATLAGCGCAPSTITITVVRAPQAAFTFNGLSTSFTVNFVNQSTGGNLTYDWDFDTSSASTDSTVASPQHSYPAVPASFTVRLTVTNSAGSSTVFQSVTVPFP